MSLNYQCPLKWSRIKFPVSCLQTTQHNKKTQKDIREIKDGTKTHTQKNKIKHRLSGIDRKKKGKSERQKKMDLDSLRELVNNFI